MDFEKEVAIVGMSCVFPQAPNLRQYWSNNVNGVDAVIDRPSSRWRHCVNWDLPKGHEARLNTPRAGFLTDGLLFDPIRYGVLPNLVRHGDPDQFLMLHLIDEALRDARIAEDDPVRVNTDVLIGRGGYATGKLVEMALKSELFEDTVQILERKFPEMFRGRRDEVERYLRSTLTPQGSDNVSTAVSNITASRAANRFNLRGVAYVVDAACASSLLAVDTAVLRLRTHQSDLAVAAGLFLTMNPTFLFAFTSLGAVSESQVIRPFDRRADGLMVGEGGGAVILKRLSDAVRDGDQVYAVIRGTGTSSDGRELDVLAPNVGGQMIALERAYKDAGIDRDTIGYLEAHGTGTDAGDAAESETIKRWFGSSSRPATSRCLGSVKSMIGHTMPAAGMASLVRVAMALSNKILPPSLHCEQPRDEILDSVFYINTQTRPWVQSSTHGPRRAAINAFGFGGINAHLVLEETPDVSGKSQVAGHRPIEPCLVRDSELAVFSGGTRDALEGNVRRLLGYLATQVPRPTLADVCYTLAGELDIRDAFKLAIIAKDLDALVSHCESALAGIAAGSDFESSEEIYYSASAGEFSGKVALIFPGMGFPGLIGNYPDHLLELCLHYPEVREEFDFFEERDRHPEDTDPTSAIFSPPASLPEEFRKQLKGRLAPPKADSDFSKETSPHERYLAAMGVTLANWVSWVLLRKFKIPVDMVTGQSQGEMAALCAVGVGDFHESAPSFWRVLDVDTRDRLGGRLAFAWASGERLEALVAEYPGTYVAIYMAPVGVIFGGDRDGLEAICEKLRDEEVLVQILPYPPIHTPSLSHLKADLMAKLDADEFDIQPARIPIYSSITTELYPTDPAGIRETLMYNVDRPLRIWQTIQRMYKDGARAFVQVGGGHMSAHLELLLPEGHEPVVTAAMDTDTRNPMTQLNHLCATLLTAGVSIDVSPLFEYRHVQSLELDSPSSEVAKRGMAVPLRIDWMPSYSDVVPPLESVDQTNGRSEETLRESEELKQSAPFAAEASANGEGASSTDLVALLPIDAETARRLGVLGEVLEFTPETSIVVSRWFSLESDPYLADHLFVHAPSKSTLERLPVIPLTMSLEFAAEVGCLLSPGLGLVGYENVRAMRWMGLKDVEREELRIEAQVRSTDEETGVRRIEVKFWCGGTLSFQLYVLFSPTVREDLPLPVAEPDEEQAWPITAEQIYSERYMFHGEAFHVFGRLDRFGNPRASGGLSVLPKDRLFAGNPDPILLTDPCLMDGIGQIVGLWSIFHQVYILPAAADRIEIYGGIPPVGTVCPVRMEVVELNVDSRQIRCNVEIEDGFGNVWVRVEGWTEWVMNWSREYSECTRMPNWFLLGSEMPLPGMPEGTCCVQVTKENLSAADPDWQARIFLHTNEMPEFEVIDRTRNKRAFLLSRCAIKDAVRLWWSRQHGCEYPYPNDLMVSHDALGAPYLEPADESSWPRISVSHKGDTAIGVASLGRVGIDLESVDADGTAIRESSLTPGEQERVAALASQMPEEAWEVRFWCAKEALGKRLGTGLGGRPKQFEVVEIDPSGGVRLHWRETGEMFDAVTIRWNGWILAYSADGMEPGAAIGSPTESWKNS